MKTALQRRTQALAALALALAVSAMLRVSPVAAQITSGTTAQGLPTTQTDDTLYTVTGQVVNSVTSEPIVRALVQVMGKTGPRAAFTDHEGRFTFNKMQAMTGNLMAVKPGFYGDQGGGRVQMAQQRITIGPNMDPIVVKLVPEAGITGQIVDDTGEPLENVRVGVMTEVIQNGRKRQQRGGQTQTDEQGEFRLMNLPPGKYYLSAGPVWTSSAESKSGNAAMFYPGVAESTEAQPIDVQAGQVLHADLSLPPAKTFVLAGYIRGEQPGYPQIVNQAGDVAGVVEVFDQNTGKFSARVTCSMCTIKSRSGDPRRDFEYGEQTLAVNGDKRDVNVTMSRISIPVKVTYNGTKPDFVTANGDATTPAGTRGSGRGRAQNRNAGVFLRLISLSKTHSDAFSAFGGGPDAPENFMQNVEFGKYDAEVFAQGGGWYVSSVTYGSTNLDDEPANIVPGASQGIEVVLKDDVASLSGNVTGVDDQNQAVTVVLVPARASARVRTFPVTGNGTFQASNLAPGNYKLYAFDSIKDLEYANPDAMKVYSASATDVVLEPNGAGTANVVLIKRAQ